MSAPAAPMTPPRNVQQVPVCPGAPQRNRPDRIQIPVNIKPLEFDDAIKETSRSYKVPRYPHEAKIVIV